MSCAPPTVELALPIKFVAGNFYARYVCFGNSIPLRA
jgi:hypothetical protein